MERRTRPRAATLAASDHNHSNASPCAKRVDGPPAQQGDREAPVGLPPVADVPLATPSAKAKAAAGEGVPSPAVPAGKRPKKARPHPYAAEASPPEELALRPGRVALGWIALAVLLIGSGYALASRY